jgi:hypothetical protein
MIYKYLGMHGINIPQGIGVKQINCGDLFETVVPIEQLGFNGVEFELIPLDRESVANKERQGLIEFKIQEEIKVRDKFMAEQEARIKDMNSEIEKAKLELELFIREHATEQPKVEKKSKIKEE